MHTASLLTVTRCIWGAGGCLPLPSTCWDKHPPAQCMLGYTPHVDRQTPVKTLSSEPSFAGGKKTAFALAQCK